MVPSERVSTYWRWCLLALRAFYLFISGLLFYFNYARFDVSMGGASWSSRPWPSAAVLLWNGGAPTTLERLAAQPSPETEGVRVELKSIRDELEYLR